MKKFKQFLVEYSPQEVARRNREDELKSKLEELMRDYRLDDFPIKPSSKPFSELDDLLKTIGSKTSPESTSQTLPGMDLTAELGQTAEKIDAINDPTRGGQTGIFGKPGNTGSNQKPSTPPWTPPTTPPWTPYKPYDKNEGRKPCLCCGGKGYTNDGNSVKKFMITCSCCGGSGFERYREKEHYK